MFLHLKLAFNINYRLSFKIAGEESAVDLTM